MDERTPLRVGLIGYGAIGQDVTHCLTERNVTDIVLVSALIRHPALTRPPGSPKMVTTVAALLAEKPDVVVEAATHEALREHGPALLRAGVDLMLICVGALTDTDLMYDILDSAQLGGARVKVVSGAIGALDALAAASLGGLSTVTHTIRRSPKTLLSSQESVPITVAQEVFRGSARQAVFQFPQFVNVTAAVALAGMGFDQTEVRVLADPAVGNSLHEVQAEGAFGSLRCTIEHMPIPSHGRGARLVAMSIVHNLLLRRATLLIG